MDGTETGSRPLSRKATSLLHFSQLVLATVVLGLDAYGVRHITYNVLVYSLVVALCTIFVCVYWFFSRNVSQELLALYSSAAFQRRELSAEKMDEVRKMKHKTYFTLSLYILMLVFWVVDLGLVASLATIWGEPGCTYSFWNGYQCMLYEKRNINKRNTTSYGVYFGALVTGACLAAVQVVLWAGTVAILLSIIVRLHRLNKSRVSPRSSNQPVGGMQEATSMWDEVAPAIRNGAEPILPSPEPGYQPSNFFTDSQPPHAQYSTPSRPNYV